MSAEIPARELRPLTIDRHPDGRPAHVAAASAIVVRGSNIYVAADDELHLARFELDSSAPGTMHRIFPGTLPTDPKQRKKFKPDIEALTFLPADEHNHHGALLGLPSGSKERRRQGFVWALAADGQLTGAARPVDFGGLLDAIDAQVPGELNVEGATVVGNELVVLNRGNGKGRQNHVARVDLRSLSESVAQQGWVRPQTLVQVTGYDLGSIDGVPLTFSDATTVGDRVLFTATAEDTDNSYDDGPVRGSVIGWLDLSGDVQDIRRLGVGRRKVEGVAVLPGTATGELAIRLVTDDDDPLRPASLLGALVSAPQ